MRPTPTVPAEPPRVLTLDGLRGLAILLVLFHHFAPEQAPDGDLVMRACRWVGVRGWVGVDLFFVLSGFLITGILYDAKGSAGYFRNFYGRRTLRIFPLYYAALAFFFVGVPLLAQLPGIETLYQQHVGSFRMNLENLSGKQAWLWLYGANVKIAVDGSLESLHFLAPFWSLAVEEHFYLLWPLAVFAFNRSVLLRLCGFGAALALALRVGCVLTGWGTDAAYVLTPCRLDGLCLGGALALLTRGPGGLLAWRTAAGRALKVLFPVVAASLVLCRRWDLWMSTVGFTLLALMFTAMLLRVAVAPVGSWTEHFFGNPILRFFGKYSYGLYVLHAPLVFVFGREKMLALLGRWLGSTALALPVYFALLTGASVALALTSWHLLERPFLRLKRFFPTHQRDHAPGPLPVAADLPAALSIGAAPVALP